ncbi:MAG: carbohydrate ABC transporter permease, partial [Spirochaetales bacterium]|nr:carbohydrate ABC transporter permease [Spirochaetales bacterium]
MVRDTSKTSRVFDLIIYFSVFLFSASILYPFIYMFSISISDPLEVGYLHVTFLPRGPVTFNAYKTVINDPTLLRSYLNSILYTVVGTGFTILITSLGGYVLSRRKFAMKKFFTILFI